MKTRAITAFFFVIVMVLSFLLGAEFFVLFYTLLTAACLYEFYGMVKTRGIQVLDFLGLGLTVFISYVLFASKIDLLPEIPLYSLILIPAVFFLTELFRNKVDPFQNIGFNILGMIYVVFPFLCFMHLAFVTGSFHIQFALGFFIMLWSNDTGAYLVGRFLGKNKLYERISPKKTWEGFFGGILIAAFAAFIFQKYFPEHPLYIWISMAVVIGVVGTLGDLVESMLKRSLNVKDSGKLLPGHGGLLDRFDGLLLAGPAVLFLLNVLLNV